MMEDRSSELQSAEVLFDSSKNQEGLRFESLVVQIAERIKDEPLLLAIAIVTLLISLTTVAVGLGSADLRFIIVVIALLAFVVIVGYYISAGIQMRSKMQREKWKYEEGCGNPPQTKPHLM